MGQRPTRIRRERRRDGQEQPMTELRGQLRAMEEQITYLQRQLSTRDWVISRNKIYMETNEVLGKGAWGRVVRG